MRRSKKGYEASESSKSATRDVSVTSAAHHGSRHAYQTPFEKTIKINKRIKNNKNE